MPVCGTGDRGFESRQPPKKFMNVLKESNLKLAIQKDGRLTEDTLFLLHSVGLNFESYRNKLFVPCRNFPIDILYVRDDDITGYVASGAADMGIVGQNMVFESKLRVKKLLNLRFGFCSLAIAIPEDSHIKTVKDLKGKIIATSYPKSTKEFFKKNKIDMQVIKISGSVEIAPALGVSEAISDIVATGSTLATNGLRVIEKISDSEAVLIATPKKLDTKKEQLKKQITGRIRTVLSARNYKLVSFQLPKAQIARVKKLIPALKGSLDFEPEQPYINIQVPIKEEVLWETLEKVKSSGATKIIVSSIENIIN